MGETGCGRQDGMETTGQTMGGETVWPGTRHLTYGGMVDGENRNQPRDGSGNRGR